MANQSNKVGKALGVYRRLLKLAKPEWPSLVLGTLFLAIGSAAGLAFPKLAGVLVDRALEEGLDSVNRAALWLLIIFVIQSVAVAIRYFLFTLVGQRIVAKLRSQVYGHIMGQEVGFFDQRKTGELLSRLSSDATTVQNAVSVNISMVLRSLAMVIGGVIMLIISSPTLAVLMLVIVPPISLGTVFYGRKIRKLSKEFQDALARAAEVAEETISGIRTVRAFAREQDASDQYHREIMHSLKVVRSNINYTAVFQAVVNFSGFGVIALVLWYGGRLVVTGDMTTGALTEFMLYTVTIAFSFATLGGLSADFMRAAGAAERMFEILDRTPEIPTSGGLEPDQVQGRIQLDDLHFAYPSRPDVPALQGVTFEVQPGQVVALVGPSGAGKSTVASLLPRFYDPTQGAIRIDDRDLTEYDPQWLRRQIGIVPQDPMLFSNSIRDNIAYGADEPDEDAIIAAAKSANAHEFISQFPEGYDTKVGERGVQLSGGQRQRVAIARAVLKNPRILILDEATSALDAESEHLVKQALDRLMEGRTTIIIAHRLSTVRDADRVIVIEKGKLLESGSHEALMDQGGLYRKLVERQFIEVEG